jgi:hypothetical protein
MKALPKRQFKNLDRSDEDKMKSCAICKEDYGETDEVAELKCDKRHFFHTHCI